MPAAKGVCDGGRYLPLGKLTASTHLFGHPRGDFCGGAHRLLQEPKSKGHERIVTRLLGLMTELQKQRYTYKCYFDANVFHELKNCGLQYQAHAYNELLKSYSMVFIEVPSRMQADDAILSYAQNHGTAIISNDQYYKYKTKYRWLEETSKWRVPFVVHPKMIQLCSLKDMEVRVPISMRLAMEEFAAACKTVPAGCAA